ncbi:hypothetical protein D3C75_1056870 [compost metagenome]
MSKFPASLALYCRKLENLDAVRRKRKRPCTQLTAERAAVRLAECHFLLVPAEIEQEQEAAAVPAADCRLDAFRQSGKPRKPLRVRHLLQY